MNDEEIRGRGRPRKYQTPEEAAIAHSAQKKANRDRNPDYYKSKERKEKQRQRARARYAAKKKTVE